MQRSFSIVDDDDNLENVIDSDKGSKSPSPKPFINELDQLNVNNDRLSDDIRKNSASNLSARNRSPMKEKLQQLPNSPTSKLSSHKGTESDSEDSSGDDDDNRRLRIPGEYDPRLYEDLDVDDEIREIFQYITKYSPQHLNLDYKFKPFIPEFLPAVGDIDAFLKVIPPEKTISGDIFDYNALKLGLHVLDEPSTNQSDPALLHLQLRASLVNPNVTNRNDNVVVKHVENLEKGSKVIDKWIKDISDLHKSKSSPVVRYSQPMPDLDELMQQWPEDMEKKLKEEGFPRPGDYGSTSDYINAVCEKFQIPVGRNKIQSLHLLFCLYAAIKSSQLYQSTATNGKNDIGSNNEGVDEKIKDADQLILD